MWKLPLLSAALLPAAHGNLREMRPLTSYPSEEVAGAAPGVRRYKHSEAYRHKDGSDLSLRWEVEADPASIMSVDLAEKDGARVVHCEKDRMVLRVPEKYVSDIRQWKHVTASDRLHGCEHLAKKQEHMYRRIEKVEQVAKLNNGGADVHMITHELTSPSDMFPFLHASFHYMPAAAKQRDSDSKEQSRRLQLMSASADMPTMTNSLMTPGTLQEDDFGHMLGEDGLPQTSHDSLQQAAKGEIIMGHPDIHEGMEADPDNDLNSLFNFNSPKQLSNLHWNWDYDADTQTNPEFEFNFPGGDGWLRLYKPYFKAHFGLTVNITSKLGPVGAPPIVTIHGLLEGVADMKLDAATAVDFTEDSEMNPLNRLELPFIGKTTEVVNPIKFTVGGTVLQIKPEFTCHLNAYHVGRLQGSLRVSLDTKLDLTGLTTFNSLTGLQANFSAKMKDVKFTPPTWMVFTRHFELGLMLEPEVLLKGGMGMREDMEFGIGMRPYMNVSIMEKGQEVGRNPEGMSVMPEAGVGGNSFSGGHSVVFYPYRAVGLPNGQTFALQVEVNGEKRKTEGHLSIDGVCDFNEQIGKFSFGSMTEDELVATEIKVSVLSVPDLNELASATTTCPGLSSGECLPGPDSPFTVSLNVNGANVLVLLSTAFMVDPVTYLTGKVKGVEFTLPKLGGFSHAMSAKLKAAQDIGFVLKRNGRVYDLPLDIKNNTNGEVELEGSGIYDLGLRFLDSWKELDVTGDMPAAATKKATLSLLIDGQEVGKGGLPEVQWQAPELGMPSAHEMTKMMAAIYQGQSLTQKVPLVVALHEPYNQAVNVATGDMTFYVDDPTSAAYWVFPKQAEVFRAGETKTLYWTTHMTMGLFDGLTGSDRKVPFKLGAKKISNDGTPQRIGWHADVEAECKQSSDVKIETYTGGGAQCVFSYSMTVPASLAGNTLMFEMEWTDANKHLHRMLSSAVTFAAARRLGDTMAFRPADSSVTVAPVSVTVAPVQVTAAPSVTIPPVVATVAPTALPAATTAAPNVNSPWGLNKVDAGTESKHRWQGSKGQSSQEDFAAHLAASGKTCDKTPLEYSLGFGILERTDIAGGEEMSEMMNMMRMAELMGGGSMMGPMGMAAMSGMSGMGGAMGGMPGMPGVAGGMGGPAAAGAPNPLLSAMGAMGGAAAPPAAQEGTVQSPYAGMPTTAPQASVVSGNPLMGLMAQMSDPALIGGQGVQTSYTPIMSENMEQNLADLLPKSICSGGLCNGEMPGCKPEAVNPITLKQIVFRLSRMFKLEDFFTPQQREAIAYGLATLPEAIDFGETELKESEKGDDDDDDDDDNDGWSTEPEGRRLKQLKAKDVVVSKKHRELYTNELHVRVTKPMLYEINEHMVQKLIDQNAFSLLSDGREKTHGDIKIVGFHLVDPPASSEDSKEHLAHTAMLAGAAGLLTIALTMMVFRLARGHGYTEVAEESAAEIA